MSSYWSARLAWADHLSHSADIADRQRAVALAPAWASLYERLTDRRSELGQSPLAELRSAAMLEPENPASLERLAQYAEAAGDDKGAERALLASAERSRLFTPRYLLAQFYFRHGNGPEFRRWARAALEIAPGDVLPLLELCWHSGQNAAALLPARDTIQRQWLTFLVRQREWDAAADQVQRTTDRTALLEYIDAAIDAGEPPGAADAWNALCRRGEIACEPVVAGTIANAGFAWRPIGHGFDWQRDEVSGVDISFGSEGLRLMFDGSQPELCTLLRQYFPVESGARYRASSRGAPPGLSWVVENVGVHGDLARIRLVYRRLAGAPRFEGVATLSDLRLERVP